MRFLQYVCVFNIYIYIYIYNYALLKAGWVHSILYYY